VGADVFDYMKRNFEKKTTNIFKEIEERILRRITSWAS
jgi:hypothetical protein